MVAAQLKLQAVLHGINAFVDEALKLLQDEFAPVLESLCNGLSPLNAPVCAGLVVAVHALHQAQHAALLEVAKSDGAALKRDVLPCLEDGFAVVLLDVFGVASLEDVGAAGDFAAL